MTVLTGQKAGFWNVFAESTLAEGEGMTRVGSTSEFYITDRTKCNWDPNQAVVVKVGGTAVTPSEVDYAGGYVLLSSYTAGAVTCDIYYSPIEFLGGGYEVDVDFSAETADVTTFSNTLNSPQAWKTYVGNGIKEWGVNLNRYYFFAKASKTVDCTNENSDLIWTWKKEGTAGNDEQVRYVVSGTETELSVARADNLTTVTVATDELDAAESTAAQVKTAAEAAVGSLYELSYPAGQDGSGIVEAKSAANLTGGRDSDDIARLGTKVLCVVYLNITTGSIIKLEGVGYLKGISPNVKLEEPVESPLEFQGTGRLRMHTN